MQWPDYDSQLRTDVTRKLTARRQSNRRWDSALLIKSLFLLKVVPEVIDPMMGPFQLGRIERQLRAIEAANIRIRDLLPLVYPSIGGIETRDVGRQTLDKIVGWNHSLRIIFPHDCIYLCACEDGLDGKNEDVYIS